MYIFTPYRLSRRTDRAETANDHVRIVRPRGLARPFFCRMANEQRSKDEQVQVLHFLEKIILRRLTINSDVLTIASERLRSIHLAGKS